MRMSHIIYKHNKTKHPTVLNLLIARSGLNTIYCGKIVFAFPIKQIMKSSYYKISKNSTFYFICNSLLCMPPSIPHSDGRI